MVMQHDTKFLDMITAETSTFEGLTRINMFGLQQAIFYLEVCLHSF